MGRRGDTGNLGLVRNSIPPFVKGAGGIFPRRLKANPPYFPLFKGGFSPRNLFKDKLLVIHTPRPRSLFREGGINAASWFYRDRLMGSQMSRKILEGRVFADGLES